MKLNIKAAFNTLIGGFKSSFFSSFYFGGKVVDSGAFNRNQLINAYINGIEVRSVGEKYIKGFVSIPIKEVDVKTGKDKPTWRTDLLNNPNPQQVKPQLEADCALQHFIFDEYFIHGGTMGVVLDKGKAEFLKILQGQYVSFEIDENGNIVKFVNTYNQTKKLELDAVKATIGSVLDPAVTLHATSKLITATKVIKKLEQAHDNEINSFANNGVGGIVSAKSEDSFTKEQHDNFLERLNDSSKANALESTSGAIDYHNINKTPSDLGVLESSKQGQKALGLVYNMPLALISEDASTFDNVKAAEKSYALNVLIPDKQLYCDKITEFLNGKKDGVKFIVDVNKVRQIQNSPKEVQETYDSARASVNERRVAAGLEALKDVIYNEPLMKIQDQIGPAPDIDLV